MPFARWGALLLAVACTVPQKRAVVDAAIDDPGRRQRSFEATLEVLDENPEYVDEFFRLALERHPATLGRFLRSTVGAYEHSEELLEWSAAELVRDPAALRNILVKTLDAAEDREPAREAIAAAIGERPRPAARVLAEQPEVAFQVTRELAQLGGASMLERLRSALGDR